MKGKKVDAAFAVGYVMFFSLVAYLVYSGMFDKFNATVPFIAGFVQFAIFSTTGELLSGRLLYGNWTISNVTFYKALLWGTSGLAVTIMFNVVSNGVVAVMENGLIPFGGNAFAVALVTSCLINLFFAPIHAAAIRIFSNYIEERFQNNHRMSAYEATMSVEWGEFVDFTFFKTVPFFWIPINTLGFLLPVNLRVAFAALLSFVFGMLMTLLKLRERRRGEKK